MISLKYADRTNRPTKVSVLLHARRKVTGNKTSESIVKIVATKTDIPCGFVRISAPDRIPPTHTANKSYFGMRNMTTRASDKKISA